MADVYVPPYQASSTASGIAPTSGSTGSSGTNTDGSRRADQVAYFVRYLDAHQLSVPSHRYIYVLWIVLVGVLLLVSALHHAGIGDRSYLGAAWNKFAVKHRVIKLGKRQERRLADGLAPVTAAGTGGYSYPPKSAAQLRPQQPPKRKVFTFPSIARMLALFVFIAVPICLTLIGADYISPTVSMFNVTASFPTDASIASSGIMQKRSVQFGLGSYPTVTTNVPQYTLPYRDWWTAGDRTGEIANALTPLVVIFALKQVPFAVLSLQLFGGYAFDRLSFLHKWGGRIVWLFAAVHVGTWSVQLKIDKRYTGSLWQVAFTQPRFRWGFVVSVM